MVVDKYLQIHQINNPKFGFIINFSAKKIFSKIIIESKLIWLFKVCIDVCCYK